MKLDNLINRLKAIKPNENGVYYVDDNLLSAATLLTSTAFSIVYRDEDDMKRLFDTLYIARKLAATRAIRALRAE